MRLHAVRPDEQCEAHRDDRDNQPGTPSVSNPIRIRFHSSAAAGVLCLAGPRRIAVHIDATVTAGTNSAEEKADFIDKTMKLLRTVIGAELSPVTYIVIHEIPAQSWGYDGRTQENRRLAVAA
jgi:phenylpyruvate tautomerase PptA (4-oxalocrotonate tautomerase family)